MEAADAWESQDARAAEHLVCPYACPGVAGTTDDGGVLGAGCVDLPQAVVPVPFAPWRHSETR
eukprot:6697683-Pyramimonas_sp.AAC.1